MSKKEQNSNVRLIRQKADKQADSAGEMPIIENQLEDTPPEVVTKDALALEAWNTYLPELNAGRITTQLDRNTLASYCIWWSKWVRAEEVLQELDVLVCLSDTGGVYQHPYVSIAKQASEMVRSWGAKLGLTPRDRMSLKIQPIKPDSIF